MCKTNTAKYDTVTTEVIVAGADSTPPTVANMYKNDDGSYYKLTVTDGV